MCLARIVNERVLEFVVRLDVQVIKLVVSLALSFQGGGQCHQGGEDAQGLPNHDFPKAIEVTKYK